MTVTVNGAPWEVTAGTTVADVVARLGIPERGVAVALDGALVRQASWRETALHEGSHIDVLTAVQGG